MAKQDFFQKHWTDENGNPAGGVSTGKGFTISWQNGPLGRVGTDERQEPNGAFVENVLEAVKDRLQFYQDSGFACDENDQTIKRIDEALETQRARTKRRTANKTEGTHEGN